MAKRKKIIKPVKIKQTVSKKLDSIKKKFVPKNKKNLWLLAVVFAVVAGLAMLLNFKKGLFIAASVNGSPLSRYELIRELEKRAGARMLDELINRKLIYQEGDKKGITVQDAEIDTEIERVKKTLEGRGTTLEQTLSLQGQPIEDFRENIRLQKVVEKLLSDKLAVSDEEAKTYFEQNKVLFAAEANFEDASVKEEARIQAQQVKLGSEFRTWIEEVKSQAKIKYFTDY